jgi:hypothetical protein
MVNATGWALGLGSAVVTGIGITGDTEIEKASGDLSGVYGLVGMIGAFVVGTIMIAVLVSIGQWLLLRHRISKSGRWILLSAVGMVVGIVIALSVSGKLQSWILLHTIVAILQWFVLQREVSNSNWWILAGIGAGIWAGIMSLIFERFLLAVLWIPPVMGSTVTGTVLVWLLNQSPPLEQLQNRGIAVVDSVFDRPKPEKDISTSLRKREKLITKLPLTVPVEPRASIVLILSIGIGLAWMMLGILTLFVIEALPQFNYLVHEGTPFILIVIMTILVMIGAFVLSLQILTPLFSWIAKSGTLTLDENGMKLMSGESELAFTWSQPVYVRNWNAGFFHSEYATFYENMYEVWHFEQGSTQMTVSRRKKEIKGNFLSSYVDTGQSHPTTERGLFIPLKSKLVFNIISNMGNLEYVEKADDN